MLFQGQEFLEDEWFRDSVPVDWTKLERFAGVHQCYRDLIALRLNRNGHSGGLTGAYLDTHHVDHGLKVLGFHRRYFGGPGDDVIVMMNLSNQMLPDQAIGVPAAGVWRVRLNSDAKKYSEDFGGQSADDMTAIAEPLDGLSHRVKLALTPYSLVILSQDPAAKPA